MVTFVKELIKQGIETLQLNCPGVRFGVYSAGMNRKESQNVKVVYGQVQSMYKKTAKISEQEPPALVIVDEAQTVPPDGEGMYQQMLQALHAINPNVKLVGLTATPFRMKTGFICNDDGPFHDICYKVGVNPLIKDGFLSPLIGKAGLKETPDLSKLKITGNEYNSKAAEELMIGGHLVSESVKEIVSYTRDQSRKTLVFTVSVKHMELVRDEFHKYVDPSQVRCLTGDTPADERRRVIAEYKAGRFQYLLNIQVLTVGFDCPDISCVAVMRPTLSPGLWAQMIGRGFRIAEGKKECLILDYGRNIITHGPLDEMDITWTKLEKGEPVTKQKVCPKCGDFVNYGVQDCPSCGFHWEKMERGFSHDTIAHEGSPLGDGEPKPVDNTFRMEVVDWVWAAHLSKSGNTTLRVEYYSDLGRKVSEYICLEHTGFARGRAEAWWECMSKYPCPDTVDEAIDHWNAHLVAEPYEVHWIKDDNNYDRITVRKADPPPPFDEERAAHVAHQKQLREERYRSGGF